MKSVQDTRLVWAMCVGQVGNLALATARSSVTAQEQVVASMLERFSTPATGPNLVANPVEEAGRPGKRESKKSTGTGT